MTVSSRQEAAGVPKMDAAARDTDEIASDGAKLTAPSLPQQACTTLDRTSSSPPPHIAGVHENDAHERRQYLLPSAAESSTGLPPPSYALPHHEHTRDSACANGMMAPLFGIEHKAPSA